MKNIQLILASASPRRAELLSQVGIPFHACPSRVVENLLEDAHPGELAQTLAQKKAADVFKAYPDDLVLGADTIVALDGRMLGKPASRREAADMLSSLSGRKHWVYTGIALLSPRGERLSHTATEVCFKDLSRAEIDWYLDSGEPYDKAGAYGIQGKGALFVRSISGCYSNVVGLPLSLLVDELKQMGISPWDIYIKGGETGE